MPKWIGGEVRGRILYERSTVSRALGKPWRGRLTQDQQDGHWFDSDFAITDEFGTRIDRRTFDNYDFNPARDRGGS